MEQDSPKIPWPNKEASDSPNVLFYAHFEVRKHYSKKNQKQIGMYRGGASRFAKRTGYTPFIMSTKDARVSERELLLLLMQRGVYGIHVESPISGMAVSVVLVIESSTALTKKGQINKRGGDIDNISTSYLDLLMKANVLEDDSSIFSLNVIKKHSDKNKITIWILKHQ